MNQVAIRCLKGRSADREVLVGFAPASLLHRLSFADVLNEETGRGYQRKLNQHHSLDFRRYIQRAASTTIPLTFNLRPRSDSGWKIEERDGSTFLVLEPAAGRVLSQVDCQHRLGHLSDLDVELPFLTFMGLSEADEMAVFNIINGKAKGLSASLLDFHDARLSSDLANDRPELYIALFLKNEPSSPWYQQLDLGGASTSGLERRASLRTLQKAVRRFLNRTDALRTHSADEAAQMVLEFWRAVVLVLDGPWSQPRKYILTKGVGVYALMELAADFVLELRPGMTADRRYFASLLSDFAMDFDWTTQGPLKGLGGEGGVAAALEIIRLARRQSRMKVVANG